MRLRLVMLLLAALMASGCSMLEAFQMEAEVPKPCIEVYSRSRCLAMVDQAAAEISKTRADVTVATIIPDPPPEGATLGGAHPILLRITLADGSTHDARMCGGLARGPPAPRMPDWMPGHSQRAATATSRARSQRPAARRRSRPPNRTCGTRQPH